MPIDRYDHYGSPRLYVTETGIFLIRDVLDENGRFSGVCENAAYQNGGEIIWHVCREGEDFDRLAPFLANDSVKSLSLKTV